VEGAVAVVEDGADPLEPGDGHREPHLGDREHRHSQTEIRDGAAQAVQRAAVALKVTLVTAALIVPIGVVVGSTAALVGGRIDTVAMRYVDVQQVIPPFFLYIVAQYVFGPTLFLIVVLFGVLNWGGTVRQLRSEALQVREEGFMLAARSAGAGTLGRLRRHPVRTWPRRGIRHDRS